MTSHAKKKEALAEKTMSKRALKKEKRKASCSGDLPPTTETKEQTRLKVLEMLKDAAKKRNS